jgi:hypothetical protein
MRPHCKLASVVTQPSCSVSVCNHGVLHVTIGAVTLRLSSHAFPSVVEVLDQALTELRRADAAVNGWH